MGSKNITLFTTKSCTQCPIVKARIGELPGHVEVVDAEDNPEVAAELGIMSVPAIVDTNNDVHIGTGACLAFIETNKEDE